MWEMKLRDQMTGWEQVACGTGAVGVRVHLHVKEHPRPRTQKKWDRRFGTVSFTIPASVIEQGSVAVRECIREARRLARVLRA